MKNMDTFEYAMNGADYYSHKELADDLKQLRCPVHNIKAFFKPIGSDDHGEWSVRVKRCCCPSFFHHLQELAHNRQCNIWVVPPYTRE